MRLAVDAPCEIWLKLECLQPIGSFKLRGATSAIRQADEDEWRAGVWTTSAGNMAQGVCWVARELGVPATVVAPDHAPRAKLDAIARLGGRSDHRAVRHVVGDDGDGFVPRASRGSSSTPSSTSA